MNYNFVILVAAIFLWSNTLIAQRIVGTVLDANDNTSIPFVNIHVKGTTVGGASDFDGKFRIDYNIDKKKNDSLVFSFIGYATKTIALKGFKNRSIVYLKKEAEALNEVILSNKALPYDEYLMRMIISNKRYNDPEKVIKSQFIETSLLSVFLANLEKGIVEKRRFKKDKDAFITDSDSTVMMPVLLAKEIIRHRVDRDENVDNEKIISIEQEGTLEQLNSLIKTTINKKITQKINFYDENIDLLGRSFQSPITSDYKTYYKVYLSDSTMVNGVKQYEFQFYPKNKKSVAFDGSFWVESETFALTKITAILPIDANVNFIKELKFEVDYEKAAEKKWYVKSRKTNTTFSFIGSKKKKEKYFSVQKHQKYTDFQLGYHKDLEPIVETKGKQIAIDLDFENMSLDSLEFKTVKGIRQLKNNGYIKFLDRFTAMTLNGYYNMNRFDLGPYFDFYHNNGIEGSRFTLPLRTSEKMFEHFSVGGYLGYGTKDKGFKYGVDVNYLLPSEKRTVVSLKYFDDFRPITKDRYIEFVRENPSSVSGGGNVLSVFSDPNRLNYSLLRQKYLGISISHEATENARYLVRPFYNEYKDNAFNRLEHNLVNVGGFRNVGMLIDLRYSKARNFDQQYFSRIYYGTTKPVYHLTAEVGHNKVMDTSSDYSAYYMRLNASIKRKFLLGSTFFKMFLDGGYIYGKVPYPLLNNPSGNQNIGLARFNYNLLNPTSFSSDIYTNLHLSFNGGGFLFNRIPLLANLNIRESMSFKAFYGSLGDEHHEFFKLPADLEKIRKEPYMELGIGVANIFKVLRIEYVRRINSGLLFDRISAKGGIKFRIEVSF